MHKTYAVLSVIAVLTAVCLVALFGSVPCHGAPPTEEVIRAERVVAQRIELVDAKDRQRGVLCLGDDGTAYLILGDERDKPLLYMAAKKSGETALLMKDPAGRTRLMLTADAEGSHVVVRDKADNDRVQIAVRGEEATVALNDPAGRKRVMLISGKEGMSMIGVSDERGKPVFMAP